MHICIYTCKHAYTYNLYISCQLSEERDEYMACQVRRITTAWLVKPLAIVVCPVRCSSACAFWTRHGSVLFGTVPRSVPAGSNKTLNSTVRSGSDRPVRFGFFFLPEFYMCQRLLFQPSQDVYTQHLPQPASRTRFLSIAGRNWWM